MSDIKQSHIRCLWLWTGPKGSGSALKYNQASLSHAHTRTNTHTFKHTHSQWRIKVRFDTDTVCGRSLIKGTVSPATPSHKFKLKWHTIPEFYVDFCNAISFTISTRPCLSFSVLRWVDCSSIMGLQLCFVCKPGFIYSSYLWPAPQLPYTCQPHWEGRAGVGEGAEAGNRALAKAGLGLGLGLGLGQSKRWRLFLGLGDSHGLDAWGSKLGMATMDWAWFRAMSNWWNVIRIYVNICYQSSATLSKAKLWTLLFWRYSIHREDHKYYHTSVLLPFPFPKPLTFSNFFVI